MKILDVSNVLVVVSRWYGGILLGPDRFKHINNCARNILLQEGYTHAPDETGGKSKKVKGKKTNKSLLFRRKSLTELLPKPAQHCTDQTLQGQSPAPPDEFPAVRLACQSSLMSSYVSSWEISGCWGCVTGLRRVGESEPVVCCASLNDRLDLWSSDFEPLKAPLPLPPSLPLSLTKWCSASGVRRLVLGVWCSASGARAPAPRAPGRRALALGRLGARRLVLGLVLGRLVLRLVPRPGARAAWCLGRLVLGRLVPGRLVLSGAWCSGRLVFGLVSRAPGVRAPGVRRLVFGRLVLPGAWCSGACASGAWCSGAWCSAPGALPPPGARAPGASGAWCSGAWCSPGSGGPGTRLVFGRLCSGAWCSRLVFGRLVSGRLVFGRLVFGRLVFGRLVFGRLVFGRLVFGRLVFGRLVFKRLVFGRWCSAPGARALWCSGVCVRRLVSGRLFGVWCSASGARRLVIGVWCSASGVWSIQM
ncbi:hypothetical protein DNTS_025778 [Danionella cerebrum]|uniref:Impact N-terminal domain-containing protein n=1 Tax=Danionella cerebrum TaxID=2873325 RepID=A0A553N4J9_9TELE|nr:hypothetical protein DNTS_025778 [Danionella translucida]